MTFKVNVIFRFIIFVCFSFGMSRVVSKNSSLRFNPEGQEKQEDVSSKDVSLKDTSFYDDYITKYYPKAFVIRENFFSNMSPEQVADALQNITALFSQQPWFYFVNKDKDFKVANYWEYIVDQCSLISEFLKKARVNVKTNKIRFTDTYFRKTLESKSLYLCLKDIKKTAIHDFYALCADYLIKLFNEGILLKDLDQVDKYFYELEFVVERLRDSVYEIDYQETMKTCKELGELLKKRLCVDDSEMLEDYFGNDEMAKKMAKESKELGYY